MNPLAAVRYARSVRIEILVVASIVIMLFCLPVAALAAITSLGSISQGGELYNGPVNSSDTYAFGNCTYWAALKRIEQGRPIPNSWGNANTWAARAQLDGYAVDHLPAVGAIMQTTQGQYGHVAIVVSVNVDNGSWSISEMNFVGFDIVSQRSLPALAAQSYAFIHDKAP